MRAPLRIRRALLSVSDKTGIEDLGRALSQAGAELVATGNTAVRLKDAGLKVTPIEELSGSPEAFAGRMKTLSFPVCSGILYRRQDESDEADLEKLNIKPVDCVVVNFYPFEKTVEEIRGEHSEQGKALPAKLRQRLIENIDIGGPTLVRAAAKNTPDVLVLTDPSQYTGVIKDLQADNQVEASLALECAEAAWDHVFEYDRAVSQELGRSKRLNLRYGENPHQQGWFEADTLAPHVDWTVSLTPNALSYNNILDFSAAYTLACELGSLFSDHTGVVIIKHNNPCGVAWVPKSTPGAQLLALEKAWEGDPVSSFGGVLVFTDALEEPTAQWLGEKFVEVVGAPGLTTEELAPITAKRKKLKAIRVNDFKGIPSLQETLVPSGRLYQDHDLGMDEEFRAVTTKAWEEGSEDLARFGVAVTRQLKSNAIALVRRIKDFPGGFQLVGAGQGQPNRVEALRDLAVPRAKRVTGGDLSQCVMISDAFFPFRDTVDEAHAAGIGWIVQPGGSMKDQDSIDACNEHGMGMAFTGRRHFRH